MKPKEGYTLGIDGATDVLPKLLTCVIVHTSFNLFVEYLQSVLTKRRRENVATTVNNVIARIEVVKSLNVILFLVTAAMGCVTSTVHCCRKWL